jgi:cysteine desulfurase/selenocysteine lyase
MSTNIDNGLPDIAVLEQLANQLFKGEDLQSTPQHPASVSPLGYDAPLQEGSAFGIGQPIFPNIPIANGGGYPSSANGVGLSSSVAQYNSAIDLRENEHATPQHYRQSNGTIPESVAGSGASPSTIQHGNNTNLSNPQTSFPDQNLETGNINLGKTVSPADAFTQYLPFEAEANFLAELQNILSGISVQETPNQFGTGLPSNLDSAPSFYFLENKTPHLPKVTTTAADFKKQHQLSSNHLPWGFDAYQVKKDFPILQEQVNGKPLIWLDNAATTQKPKQVIDRISYFYEHENSNIHRAAHELAARATDAYEAARQKVQRFINAASPNEIVFVRGTTEAINLVAKSWGEQFLNAGDEVIVSHLEHHANIVPWQQLAAKKGIKLRVIPVDDDGQVLLDEYAKLLNHKTKLVSFTQVSNALGTVTPAKTIINLAHQAGAKVLLDGAQSVSHIRADVQALDADWFVFSGHKVFGPTGIGVVYGKEALLNQTIPWQGGGNMIKDVTFEYTQYHAAPSRFEAGTGNIADAVGLGAALDYVNKLGIDNIYQYEHYLLQYATQLLQQVPGLKLIGTAKEKTSVLSFTLQGYTNDQVGQALNKEGIAVRTGHHCAQPILRRFGLESTVRPSLAFYNTCTDVDTLVATLHQLKK